MGSNKTITSKTAKTGIFQTLKSYMQTSRLGDLLTQNGFISEQQLDLALHAQRIHYRPLGKILLDYNMISGWQLFGVISRQYALRAVTGVMLCSFSVLGFAGKKAKADYIKDIRPEIRLATTVSFNKMAKQPRLFGSVEKKSYNLKPFTKWTTMFERFDTVMDYASSQESINDMKVRLQGYQNLPLVQMADQVNRYMNEVKYITDSRNWGKSDYWATPVEFMQRGGDCEDFAIAKYTALRALGVPEERLRIAIVHDNVKNIPHAVLVVYTDEGAYILDNQIKRLVNAKEKGRYRPIFSINRTAWWLHTAPGPSETRIASAR